jgi:hypothetical protein
MSENLKMLIVFLAAELARASSFERQAMLVTLLQSARALRKSTHMGKLKAPCGEERKAPTDIIHA